MTLDDVLKLTPEQAQRRVAELTGNNLPYHTDLNAAMSLVPQVGGGGISRFMDCLEEVTLDPNGNTYCLGVCKAWMFYVPDKPLALCRAYILWKDGGK